METIEDKTPAPAGPVRDTPEALAARLKAAEANPEVAKAHQTVNGNVSSEAQTQVPPTPPKPDTPPAEVKKDGLQQFKDKEGNVDAEKIRKSNEHLERGLRDKEELLKRNKELLSKFTKTSQEAAKVKKELGATAPIPEGGQGDDIDDKRFLERLGAAQEDPKLLRKVIREEAAQLPQVREAVSFMEETKRERFEASMGQQLNELVQAGHTWIAKEGLGRFNEVFDREPWLLQSRTPYLNAMKFMEIPQESAPAPAQGSQPVPVLGGGNAIPPPSSAPTATTEQKMKDLSSQFHTAVRRGDRRMRRVSGGRALRRRCLLQRRGDLRARYVHMSAW